MVLFCVFRCIGICICVPVLKRLGKLLRKRKRERERKKREKEKRERERMRERKREKEKDKIMEIG